MKKLSTLAAFLLLTLTSATIAAPALNQKVDHFEKPLLFQGKDLRTLWEDIATGDDLDYILSYRHEEDDEMMNEVLEPLLEAVGVHHQYAILTAIQTARRHYSERLGSTPTNDQFERVLFLQIENPEERSETKEAFKEARSTIERERKNLTEHDEDKRMAELLEPKLSTALKIRLAVSGARRTIRFEKENLGTASESELETTDDDDRITTLLGPLLSNDGEAQLVKIQNVVGEARRTVTLGNAFFNGMDFATKAIAKLQYSEGSYQEPATDAIAKLQYSEASYQEPSLKYLILCAILADSMEVLNMLLQLTSSSEYLEYALIIADRENRPKIISNLQKDGGRVDGDDE